MFVISLFYALLFSGVAAQTEDVVTCGSTLKLKNEATKFNLHSHAIAWGSGSGQQSVTGNSAANDQGGLWLVKEAHNAPLCEAGTEIKCGDTIRLQHLSTGRNLHSHLFRAPLTGNQEVSGFGEGGQGDTGDNWVVVCESPSTKWWQRGKPISLKHADTGKYLVTFSTGAVFNQQNCGSGCPIGGQSEVSAATKRDKHARWVSGQGVYFPPKNSHSSEHDDEL